MSVNFPVPNSGFNLESTSFNLNLGQVQKIIEAGDGWIDTDGDGWGNRTLNEWGTAFDNQLNLIAKAEGQRNGGLDFQEKKYLAVQFNYDAMEQPRGEWLDRNVNGDPISRELAENADHFVESIFWNESNTQGLTSSATIGQMRHGLDVNSNGIFDMQDATEVAKLDGNAADLTDKDFEEAALSGTNWSPEQRQLINQVNQLTPRQAGEFAQDFARDSLTQFGLDPNMMNDNSLGQPFLQPVAPGGQRFQAPPPASQQVWPYQHYHPQFIPQQQQQVPQQQRVAPQTFTPVQQQQAVSFAQPVNTATNLQSTVSSLRTVEENLAPNSPTNQALDQRVNSLQSLMGFFNIIRFFTQNPSLLTMLNNFTRQTPVASGSNFFGGMFS